MDSHQVAPHDHVVLLYADDDELAASISHYLVDHLGSGGVGILVATPEHLATFAAALQRAGVDLAVARRTGRLVELDAAEVLDRCSRDGAPDPDAFEATIGAVLDVSQPLGAIRVYGEMVSLLYEAGLVSSAMDLEAMWNVLGRTREFSLFCAYPTDPENGHGDGLARLCHEHSEVVGSGPARAWRSDGAISDARERAFPCSPEALRGARTFIREVLGEWGLPDLVAEAEVIATELAANAVVHARSSFALTVGRRAGAIHLSVEDDAPALPVQRAVSSDAPNGRGMRLVAAMASRWGVELPGRGKRVWVELTVPSSDR